MVEKEFRKKVKDRVERQYRIVNPQATEEEVRQVTESDNPQVFSQAVGKRPIFHRMLIRNSCSIRIGTAQRAGPIVRFRNDMPRFRRSSGLSPSLPKCSRRCRCLWSSKMRRLPMWSSRRRALTRTSREGECFFFCVEPRAYPKKAAADGKSGQIRKGGEEEEVDLLLDHRQVWSLSHSVLSLIFRSAHPPHSRSRHRIGRRAQETLVKYPIARLVNVEFCCQFAFRCLEAGVGIVNGSGGLRLI